MDRERERERRPFKVSHISAAVNEEERKEERDEKDGDVAEIRKRDFNCFQGMTTRALLLQLA